MERMSADIRDLKKRNDFILTCEEKRELIEKLMLQKINCADTRPSHGISEQYLFLKALRSGERLINIRKDIKISEILKPGYFFKII